MITNHFRRMHGLVLTCVVTLAGCAGASSGSDSTLGSRTASAGTRAPSRRGGIYPIRLLAAASRTATLFPSSDPNAAAFATFNGPVEVTVLGPTERGRLPVEIGGDLPASGYIPASDLLARVQRSGDVEGTPVHLTVNDLVHVLDLHADGNAVVRAGPERLLVFDHRPELLVQAFGPNHPGFVGTYLMARLGASRVTDVERARPPGRAARLVARAQLLSSPGGEPLHDGPYRRGIACRVIAERDAYAEIMLGLGPYVRGFVPSAAVEQTTEPDVSVITEEAAPFHHPLVALVHHDEDDAQLVHVAAGAEVRFDGSRVTLRAPGYARVLTRAPTEVEVLVTVRGDVVVHGRVRADALGLAAALPPMEDGRLATRH